MSAAAAAANAGLVEESYCFGDSVGSFLNGTIVSNQLNNGSNGIFNTSGSNSNNNANSSFSTMSFSNAISSFL